MYCCSKRSLHLTICHSFSSLIAQVHTQIAENDMSAKELQFWSPWPLLSDGPTSDHVYPCHKGCHQKLLKTQGGLKNGHLTVRRVYISAWIMIICVLKQILHKKKGSFIQLQEFPILPYCLLWLCQNVV